MDQWFQAKTMLKIRNVNRQGSFFPFFFVQWGSERSERVGPQALGCAAGAESGLFGKARSAVPGPEAQEESNLLKRRKSRRLVPAGGRK